MATEEEIREQRERLSKMSSDAIRGEIPTWKTYAPARIAGELILEERRKAEDALSAAPQWHNTWWGVLILGVLGSLIVAFVVWRLGWL